MEAIGRLTGGVAHDLNNILNVIIGYSEYLISEPADYDRHSHNLNEIKSAGEKASSFIKRLLAFSRRRILQPRVVNLNFEQIIMNPIVNARDAMPEGGRITVRTGNRYLHEEHLFNGLAAQRGHYVAFEMSDNGIGFSTAYGIVKQSNGCISVKSEQGVGTVFTVRFPRVLLAERTPERSLARNYPDINGFEELSLHRA
jgi:two-component system cell cycle sensor histidine kinase/response regulator CckA